MKLHVTKDTTSKIVHIFIQDSSATDGSGLTGLVFGSSGLTAYYVRPGDVTANSISLVDCTLGTYTSGGFKQFDSTNMPGVYEFGIPNAVLATGADQAVIMLKGATNMAPVLMEIQLTDMDFYTALPDNFDILEINGFGYASANVQQFSSAFFELIDTVDSNLTMIKGNTSTVDNLENDYDGTGYNKSASTIGTATTVTNQVTANVTSISGDSTAADNAEAFFDNNGFNASASTIGTATSVTNPVDANVASILDTALTETNAGNVADNFSQFFDVEPTTTKDVNDVGSASIENLIFEGTINANLVSVYGYVLNSQVGENFLDFFDISDPEATIKDLADVKKILQSTTR